MQFKSLAALVATISTLASPSAASGPQGEATQINMYTNSGCSVFARSQLIYYAKSPKVGECFSLGLTGEIGSLNVVSQYRQAGSGELGNDGVCLFYDDFDCKGEVSTSTQTKTVIGGCRFARSSGGWLWKSARCYVNQ